jgi:threonine synthase
VAYACAESAPAAIERRPTLAEGIAIAAPARGALILAAVRASGGAFVTVEEDEIQTAWKRLGCAGMYVEPTAAATVAGVLKVAGSISTNEVVVSVLTGHGLKAAGKQT